MNSHQIRFDADLIRATTGPAALHVIPDGSAVHRQFGLNEYKAAALGQQQDPIPRPLSLYVHIPFCSSPCFYCGCTKVITRTTRRPRLTLPPAPRDRAAGQLYDQDREASSCTSVAARPRSSPRSRSTG